MPQRLLHIRDAIKEIESYIEGVGFETFSKNSMMKFATIKQSEIIGEAARHLSDEFKKEYFQISWKEIGGLRNILVHEYFGVDDMLIWQVATVDIPAFKSLLPIE